MAARSSVCEPVYEVVWPLGRSAYETRAPNARIADLSGKTVGESADPERLIPVFPHAEWIGIVVAGDWGRNQSKGYVSNHIQGPPVSKPVRLPKNWQRLRAS